MHAVIEIVLPVFGIILLGYLARRGGLLGIASTDGLNRFVYYIALPPLLFLTAMGLHAEQAMHWPFMYTFGAGLALTVLICAVVARTVFGHREADGMALHLMSAGFANTVYLGIALFQAAFGSAGAAPAVLAALLTNLLMIPPAVAVLEVAGRRAGHGVLRVVLRAMVANPVITSMMAGLLWGAADLPLPRAGERLLELLAASAGPTALFAMGMSLYGFPLRRGGAEVIWLVLAKLVLQPLLTALLVYRIWPLEPFWADSAVLLAAIPTGATVFVLAQQYGRFEQRSAVVIVATTALSIVPLSWLLARMVSHLP